MRTVLFLSAMLPILSLAPACDDEGDSAPATSATATSTTDSAESDATGQSSAVLTSTTSGTSANATGGATTSASTAGSTGGDTTGAGETAAASTGETPDPPPPTDAATLLPWLQAGTYASWDAEAARHPSEGPHFDGVRTFVNAALLASLEAGSVNHPVGSSVVKELYGATPKVGGWAVMVKVAEGSSVNNWYWYESFQGTTYADDTGIDGCGDCHVSGADFIRTTLPL
ncbi:MAG: hypothetical protein KUG77_00065 [Nannocystaceae bacterium]|nr:hypothetical protein [Nannocystaceae bacterium]